jgi:hypothetical protein
MIDHSLVIPWNKCCEQYWVDMVPVNLLKYVVSRRRRKLSVRTFLGTFGSQKAQKCAITDNDIDCPEAKV